MLTNVNTEIINFGILVRQTQRVDLNNFCHARSIGCTHGFEWKCCDSIPLRFFLDGPFQGNNTPKCPNQLICRLSTRNHWFVNKPIPHFVKTETSIQKNSERYTITAFSFKSMGTSYRLRVTKFVEIHALSLPNEPVNDTNPSPKHHSGLLTNVNNC